MTYVIAWYLLSIKFDWIMILWWISGICMHDGCMMPASAWCWLLGHSWQGAVPSGRFACDFSAQLTSFFRCVENETALIGPTFETTHEFACYFRQEELLFAGIVNSNCHGKTCGVKQCNSILRSKSVNWCTRKYNKY